MKEINVLYAIKASIRDDKILNSLREKLIAGMQSTNQLKINKLDFVFSRQEIEEKVARKEYQLLISADQFGNDNISGGSIKIWRSVDPDLRIILTLSKDKMGGAKMIKLFFDASFYDALFEDEVTGETIAQLYMNSRTADATIEYYGIQNSNEVMQMRKNEKRNKEPLEKTEEVVAEEEKPMQESPKEDSPKKVELEDIAFYAEQFAQEEPAPDTSVAVPVASEGKTEKPFGFFKSEPQDEKIVTIVPPLADWEKEEAVGTNFEDPEVATAMVNNTMATHTPVDKETMEHIMHMVDVFDEETKEVIAGVPALITGRIGTEEVLPTKGRLLRVVERNTFIIEFSEEPKFKKGESIQEYKIVVMISQSKKGKIVNNKYCSGNIIFEAYVGFMLGRVTAMMDTMDYDCVSNKDLISDRECNLMLVKL